VSDYSDKSLEELLELEIKADNYMQMLHKEKTIKSRQLIAVALKKYQRLKQAIAVKQAIEDVTLGERTYVQTK
jgi:hypothetical protein